MGRDFTLDDLKKQGYKAVFLGVGLSCGRQDERPGGRCGRRDPGSGFSPPVKPWANLNPVGKKLAVIGGGNVAMDVACTARRLGSEVTIVYRRSREEMPAHGHEIEQAYCEGVKLEFLAAPVEVVVKNGKVAGLKVQRMELGEPDASGRRSPVPIPGSEYDPGRGHGRPRHRPEGQPFRPGRVAASSFPSGAPSKLMKSPIRPPSPGVFAAGDVHTGPWIAIEAVGGGIEAAESIDRYLRGVDMNRRPPGRQGGPQALGGSAQGRRRGAPGGNGYPAAGSQLSVF